jgi:hypothetical protein
MSIRYGWFAVLAVIVGFASQAASATTIYNVDLASGGYSAKGTITTDSSTGVLGLSNILDWQIHLDRGVRSFDLDTSNAVKLQNGGALTATATGLFFDFSSPNSDWFFLGEMSNFLCFSDGAGTCGNQASLVSIQVSSATTSFSLGGGVQQIAAVAATPLPATLPLLVSALGGLGFFGWRRSSAA